VTTWYDINPQSQVKLNLTQTTATNRPTYEEDSQNHLPGLIFDGTNDDFTFATGIDFSQMKNQEFFFVVKWVSNGAYSVLLGQYDNTALDFSYVYRFKNGKPEIGTGSVSLQLSSAVQTEPRIYDGYITPSTFGMSNDAQNFETTGGHTINTTTSAQTPKIGVRSDDTQRFKGTVYELLLFSRKLKTAERKAVRDYLKNKWSL